MIKVEISRLPDTYVLEKNGQQQKISDVWSLPCEIHSIDELTCDHILSYLTSMEADLAMLRWNDVLIKGGQLRVIVPNTDHFIRLWQQSTWDNASLMNSESTARKAFAGLWGVQQNCNPRDEIYYQNVQDVYKSGYNVNRLQLLFERAGFCDIQIVEKQEELWASATKTMLRGERQVTTSYDQIRPDHLNRYEFACDSLGKLNHQKQVLDLACGIGYGSLMLAEKTGAQVTGVDIDGAAIEHAEQHFANAQTQFICENAKLLSLKPATQDAIVSFETIEHIDFDKQLLATFFKLLKPGGKLICSTPNQDVMPFDKAKFRFHLKHYTNAEVTELLKSVGFSDIQLFAQHDPVAGEVVEGGDGCFIIAIATKGTD